MRTVWVVSRGENGEGSTIMGVFEYVRPARALEKELRGDENFYPECDYVTVEELIVNETI